MLPHNGRTILKYYKITKLLSNSYSCSTVIDSQINHFNRLGKEWWDEKGNLMVLHAMNKIRIPFIRNGLLNLGVIKDFPATQKIPCNIKILDVGCGGGILTEALRKSGFLVTGIDPSSELIDVAKFHNKANDIDYYPITIERFSEENMEKFDVVISSEVVEHVCELEIFCENCVKCLKPGGSIFITTINQTILAWLIVIVYAEKVTKRLTPGTHEYSLLVTPQRLQRILENNNCRIQAIRGMKYSVYNNRWSWTKSTSTYYGVHAIKN